MPGPLSCTPTLKRSGPVALDVDPDFRQDAGLFAGVQGVVDRLLDGRQQGLARVVEAQQVPILRKELADGNIALAGGHRLGGGPAARFRRGNVAAASALPLDPAGAAAPTLGVERTVNLRAPRHGAAAGRGGRRWWSERRLPLRNLFRPLPPSPCVAPIMVQSVHSLGHSFAGGDFRRRSAAEFATRSATGVACYNPVPSLLGGGRGKADRLYRFCRRCPTWFFPNFRHIAGLFPTSYTKIHPQER